MAKGVILSTAKNLSRRSIQNDKNLDALVVSIKEVLDIDIKLLGRVGEALKFITEMELRDLYRTAPFTNFVLEPDTKLTPGARQFLTDRRIKLEEQSKDDQLNTNGSQQIQVRESWCTLRLRRKMDCIESLFLLVAAELLRSEETALAEEVMALGKYFQNVKKAEQQQKAPEKIQFWGWSEQEHFDISEFHLGLENGKEIALLNHLRASLREVEPAILEAYWDEEKQICSRQDLIDTVNLLINILCMMMQRCLGGKNGKNKCSISIL